MSLWEPSARGGFYAAILEMLGGRELERDSGGEGVVPRVYVKGLLNEQEDNFFLKGLKFLEVPYDKEVGGQGGGADMVRKRRYYW